MSKYPYQTEVTIPFLFKRVRVNVRAIVNQAKECGAQDKYSLIASLMGSLKKEEIQRMSKPQRSVIAEWFRKVADLFDPDIEENDEEFEEELYSED